MDLQFVKLLENEGKMELVDFFNFLLISWLLKILKKNFAETKKKRTFATRKRQRTLSYGVTVAHLTLDQLV